MRNILKVSLLSIIFLIPLQAFGDTEALPRSYTTLSNGGKFVFVMIAPIAIERDGLSYGDVGKQKAQIIRAKYPMSGLYLNDGSNMPLWTVDWYSHSVLVASDGIHLVREGPWASSLSDEAFTFFANGKEVKSYKVGSLVDTTVFLPHSVSHFSWEDELKLDDEKQTFNVITLSKEKYVFDYTSGEIISAFRLIRVTIGASLVLSLLIVFLLLRRRKLVTKLAV